MKIKKLVITIIASACILIPCQTAFAYSDIEGSWAESAIQALDFQGLFYNDQTGLYRPNDPQTRGETAYFIQALGIRVNFDEEDFIDVNSGTPLYKSIRHAVATGLMRSYPDGTFRPDMALTRNEAFVIASYLLPVRHEVKASIFFSDYDTIAAYALSAVEMLISYNILAGYPDNTIRGASPISRAEFAHLFTAVMRSNMRSSERRSFSDNVADWLAYPDLYRPYLTKTDKANYGVGSVSGTVTAGGIRMAAATVMIQKDGNSISLITDYNGYFTVSNLPIGSYTVTASKIGYPSVSSSVTVTEGSSHSLALNLYSGNLSTTALTGYVYDTDTGKPLAGADIYVHVNINGITYSTVTNTSGYYYLYLPTGNFYVNVSLNGYFTQYVVTPIELGKTNSQNFYLQQQP